MVLVIRRGLEPRLLPLWCLNLKSVTKGCAPLRSWKNANSISVIWCIPFANILLKIYCLFPIKILAFSYLFYPPFLFRCLCQIFFFNLWLLKRKSGCLRGMSPSKVEKNAIFIFNTYWQHFTKNSFLLLLWNIGYYQSYSSHLFLFLMPLPEL